MTDSIFFKMYSDPAVFTDVCGLDLTQPLLWTVPAVLTAAECARCIARIEALGPTPAPISTSRGPVLLPRARSNSRVILDDRRLAAELFDRLVPHLPPQLLRMRVVGVNERFRFYRYQPGQHFALHQDGSFARNAEERSLLTLLIYLNQSGQDFTGGETAFPEQGRCIRPQTGQALLFQHRLLHEGCAVKSGVKYALRSDIMYRTPR